MRPTPIAALFLSADRGEIAFDRDGHARSWSELTARVGAIAAALGDRSGDRWVVAEEDAFDTAAALFGCWAAGKVPVLVPNARLLAAGPLVDQLDGVIGNAADGALPALDFASGAAVPFTGQLDPEAELVLFTSGSTGEPKRAPKSLRHLQAELEVLEALWGASLGARDVYATVSQQHMYGLLFRLLWPLAAARRFATFTLDYPEDLISAAATDAVLVSSPALLKRLQGLEPVAPSHWHEVFSSGGLLQSAAAADARRALGVAPLEVLGSTETGGVAWRRQDPAAEDGLWRPLPEVRIRTDDEGFLSVSSPFIGHSGWFRMGDRVQVEEGRPFELLGRGDRVVKIEDKRISLVEIETAMLGSELVSDAACAAMDQDGRQSVGALVVLSEAGRRLLEQQGRRGVGEVLRKVLRDQVEPIAVPRRLRYLDEIPTDPQGKRQAATVDVLLAEQAQTP
jgi:acyl-coenzyme A synthetase/AMP-(fatty) acid ligase